MNGFSTGEEDSRGPPDQICCLIDNGERCTKAAGNASYSKGIQKTVTQRRLNLSLDNTVSNTTLNLYMEIFSNRFVKYILFTSKKNPVFHIII